jgi:putative flavoprotein involved in K+ transport
VNGETRAERVDTLVIGGGQAGLSVGYHLTRRSLPFLIVDAAERIGDVWRQRWDSLRLFTPTRYCGLDGMAFPAASRAHYPTKDEMADYLRAYAARFELPIEGGVRVERLTRRDGRFLAVAGDRRFEANNVVVAMSSYQKPRVPSFAGELRGNIHQLHSVDYRNPRQLADGPVLLVGAGNTGADIAMELAPDRQVWMSGPDVGHVPFRIETRLARALLVPLVLRVLFHRILTVATPLGRKVRPQIIRRGGPLVRVKPKDLGRAGVERVPRTERIQGGLPVLEDGRVLEPANVIWCTGFHGGFDWIDLPVHGEVEPKHRSGVVESEPGLYFVGLHFLHAESSSLVHGVGRDAERVVEHLARARASRTPSEVERALSAGAA